MKIKLFLLIILLFNNIQFSLAEVPNIPKIKNEKCSTVKHRDYLKANNALYDQQIIEDQNLLQQQLLNSSNTSDPNTIYIIPVVVHVLYFTNGQNISDAQIRSQIDVLNEDFGRTNADTTNTPQPFDSLASSTSFQFCLANRDPNGATTNGIERRQTTVQGFQTDDNMKFYSSGGLNAWNVNKYLNIWVCDLGGQVIGYGEEPSGFHTNTFGVVVHYSAFGRTGVVSAPYNLGRTCTHEISHCFNLYHIWGDEDLCSGSDYVSDTPNQAKATYGCHSFPFAEMCTVNYPGVMYMNYMDYSDDDCMNMFTVGQAARMLASVNSYYPSLKTSDGCLSNGIESLSDFEFRIYPNPSSGILDVNMFTSKNIGSTAKICITDILGKAVYETVINNPNGFVHRLDIHNLNKGIYFVTVYNDNFKKTEKISLTY